MRHLQKLLSTLIVTDCETLTCSLEGSRLGPRKATKWREAGRRWMGILATIYSLFLSSFHFSTFFSSREQKHCCYIFVTQGSAFLVSLGFVLVKKFSVANYPNWTDDGIHTILSRLLSQKLQLYQKEEMGSEISDHSHIFWGRCQSFVHSCPPAHQILHAGQLHLSLFCFRQPAKAISRAPDLSALPSPGGDRMVEPAASLSLPQPLSNPLPLLPRLPYYPPILTTPLSPTNPLQWHHSLT